MMAIARPLNRSVAAQQRFLAQVRAARQPRTGAPPPLYLVSSLDAQPRFGGEEDAPPRRKPVTTRLQRVQARAAVFLSPETLCSSQDIADIFGIREAEARSLRPGSARPIGRALMAPFADWHRALLGPQNSAPPREARRTPAPRLLPLGGPGRT